VRLAVIVGHPSEPGPCVIRVKAPGGTKLMPHRHPEHRIYPVMSGVFYIGLGDRFDSDKVQAFPPGTVTVLPGHTSHVHCAKSGEYVTQITAIGPLGLEKYRQSGPDAKQPTRGPSAGGTDRAGLSCRSLAKPVKSCSTIPTDGRLPNPCQAAARPMAGQFRDRRGHVRALQPEPSR
jgi:hypothetical protein